MFIGLGYMGWWVATYGQQRNVAHLKLMKRLLEAGMKQHILLEGLSSANDLVAASERLELSTHTLIRVGPLPDKVNLKVPAV